MYEIAAQAVGIVAMLFNILSFQRKTARGVIAFQLVGGLLFSVSFFMLDSYIGGILNVIGVVRAVLFLKKDRFHTDHILWLFVFVVLYLISYALTFTVFGKEPTAINFLIECLPVIGMTASSISFRYDKASVIRKYGLVSSGSWLIYNGFAAAVGAICCEVFSLFSIGLAMYRYDRKKKA